MEIKLYLQEQLSKRPWIRKETAEKAFQMISDGKLTIEDIDNSLVELERNYYKVYNRMGNKASYYSINDIFFECRKESTITISCKYNYQEISGDYDVLITPVLNYTYQVANQYIDTFIRVSASNNIINIPFSFSEEQQYRLTLWKLDSLGNRHLFVEYNVYALESDLIKLKFLKGDLHCHSTYSDGYEPPEQVVCSARKLGCDFLAITDHNSYEGSVKAEEWVNRNGGEITIIRGEEYSCAYTPLHILSLGAPRKLDSYNYSFYCIRNKDQELCLDERIEDILKKTNVDNYDPLAFAGTKFLFDRIRENGGFSVLCHPMWKPLGYTGNRSDAPLSLIIDLIKDNSFDGYEVVSGSTLGETDVSALQHSIVINNTQHQDFAYIGVTDSHYYSCDRISGKHFTVVFSEDATAKKIIDALRQKRSVAVEIDEKGTPLCYGPLRYVLLTYFLIKEYFPKKDRQAYLDGLKMESKLLIN